MVFISHARSSSREPVLSSNAATAASITSTTPSSISAWTARTSRARSTGVAGRSRRRRRRNDRGRHEQPHPELLTADQPRQLGIGASENTGVQLPMP
jgi:hypothetical protein